MIQFFENFMILLKMENDLFAKKADFWYGKVKKYLVSYKLFKFYAKPEKQLIWAIFEASFCCFGFKWLISMIQSIFFIILNFSHLLIYSS